MFTYSTKSFAVNMVGALILQAGTVIVGLIGTPSQVTYFNAAFRIYSSVRQLMGWLTDPFRPALSRLYVSSNVAANRVLNALSFVSLTAAFVGCGVLIVGSNQIVEIWLGDQVPTQEVGLSLAILLAGLTINAIHMPFVPAGDAAGRPGVFFPIQLAWLLMYVPLGVWLGTQFGIVGVSFALTLPLVIVEPIYLFVASRALRFTVLQWFRAVLLPALKIAGPGLLLLGVFDGLALYRGWPTISLSASGVFLLGGCLGLIIFRRQLPWPDVRFALRAEL